MSYIGFDKLKGELAKEKGVTNPGALAASIGRKKYGKKKFQKAAASGHKMKGMKSRSKDRHKMMTSFVKKNG